MMLAMDDILKNIIHLLDGGLEVFLNPIRQLNILSFVPPKLFSIHNPNTLREAEKDLFTNSDCWQGSQSSGRCYSLRQELALYTEG